ncbi:hypothetical protein ERN12_02955 [Rhodobacteraceae bacterium]|nr:hypothetical protein ERN12_02955 [Paracoccaceae bacterium]
MSTLLIGGGRMTAPPVGRPNLLDEDAILVLEARQALQQGYGDGDEVTSLSGRGTTSAARRRFDITRPTWSFPVLDVDGGPVGGPVLQFDGRTTVSAASQAVATPFCVAAVVKTPGAYSDDLDTLDRIYGSSNAGVIELRTIDLGDGALIRATGGYSALFHDSDVLPAPNDWMVIVHTVPVSGGDGHLVVTGSPVKSRQMTSVQPLQQSTLGTRSGTTSLPDATGWVGQLAELRQYAKAFTATQAVELHAMLSAKYGIPV